MKKILLLSLALLSTLSFYSCKDDDMSIPEGASDRLFRPMFRNDNSTGKGAHFSLDRQRGGQSQRHTMVHV